MGSMIESIWSILGVICMEVKDCIMIVLMEYWWGISESNSDGIGGIEVEWVCWCIDSLYYCI